MDKQARAAFERGFMDKLAQLRTRNELIAAKAGVDPKHPWMTSQGPGLKYSPRASANLGLNRFLNPHHERVARQYQRRQHLDTLQNRMRMMGMSEDAISRNSSAFDQYAQSRGLQGDQYRDTMLRAAEQLRGKISARHNPGNIPFATPAPGRRVAGPTQPRRVASPGFAQLPSAPQPNVAQPTAAPQMAAAQPTSARPLSGNSPGFNDSRRQAAIQDRASRISGYNQGVVTGNRVGMYRPLSTAATPMAPPINPSRQAQYATARASAPQSTGAHLSGTYRPQQPQVARAPRPAPATAPQQQELPAFRQYQNRILTTLASRGYNPRQSQQMMQNLASRYDPSKGQRGAHYANALKWLNSSAGKSRYGGAQPANPPQNHLMSALDREQLQKRTLPL